MIIKHLVLLKRLIWVAAIWALRANDSTVNYHQKIGTLDLRQKFLSRKKIYLISDCCKSKHPFPGCEVELLILTQVLCSVICLAKWCHIYLVECALTIPIIKNGK